MFHLVVAAVFARGGLSPGPRPCIAVGDASVEIASVPWHADLHVSFTDDPAAATVRVQISDSAEAADFAVVDDAIDWRSGDRRLRDAPAATADVVGRGFGQAAGSARRSSISPGGPADYRIFVRSKTFTAREAAALIVGAGDGHPRLTAASL